MATDESTRTQSLATLRERVDTGMDRREFLRTLASGGYALGMAQFLDVDHFLTADDGEVPVVTALVREDHDDPWSLTERTRTVPADWYAAVESAIRLNDWLSRLRVTGYLGSTVVPSSYDEGTASVSVGVSVSTGTLSDIADMITDVTIDVEQITELEDGRNPGEVEPRLASELSDGAPAGVSVETDDSTATLGPALHHRDGDGPFFSTAEHAYYAEGSDNVRGKPLSLPVEHGSSIELGTVRNAYPAEDIVAVEPNGEVEPGSIIDQSPPVRVNGQYTRWGLADLIARDEYLEKVGSMTGHTSGAIQGIDAITCFTDEFCRRGQIRWGGEMDLIDGDSGSVSYHPDPEDSDGVLIAGVNNARTWWPGQSYVWGVSAYHLLETQGYHF
ncbi:hypothetical protein OB905_04420 [Halobacteria archaeon AArc-dxtr1]|nr:hypothetical protein [Halobacteria archaeon AArc-dxtr1]